MFCVFSIRNFNLCNLKGNGNIANDFAGSVYPQRYLTKLTSDRLLRPHNGLMIYNQIERALVITKWKLTYCNSNFLLVMISKVEKNWSKTYIYKQTNHQLQRFHAIFTFWLNCHGIECTGLWDIKGSKGYIYAAFKNWSYKGISGDSKWS